MNNLPKVVAQQRRGRGSIPRLLDRKYDALPLSHTAPPQKLSGLSFRVIPDHVVLQLEFVGNGMSDAGKSHQKSLFDPFKFGAMRGK